MTKKKEVFKTQAEVERDGNVNLSVGTQKLIKVRLIGGMYDGIITEIPELKCRNMIAAGKAEEVGPKVAVMEPDTHENEARKLREAKKQKELKEVEERKTK